MEEQSPLAERQRPRKVKQILLAVLALALIFGAGGGAYYWQHGNVTSANQKIAALDAQLSKLGKTASTAQTSTNNSQNIHFVESVGYPLTGANGTNSNQFLTKLGVPSYLQVVRESSTIQNQGMGFSMFTDGTFNNELGRWELGQPTYDQDNGGGSSEISLIAISNSWINSTSTTDQSFNSFSYNNPLETPTQKQQFMKTLTSATSNCAKDPGKGFTIASGNLTVCYTFQYPDHAYATYDPQIVLEGYGGFQDQPVILVGFISIYDSTVRSESAAAIQQISQEVLKGQIPPLTVQDQQAVISALKQTTITVSPNPNK